MTGWHNNLTNSGKPACVSNQCLPSLLGAISTGSHNADEMIGIKCVHGILHNDFRRSVTVGLMISG